MVRGGVNGDYFKSEPEAILKILNYFNNQDMLTVMGKYSRELCIANFDQSVNFSNYRHIYAKNLPESDSFALKEIHKN